MFSLSQIKSANGKPRTKSLFYELSYDDPSESLFTLKERDIEVRGQPMLSLQQLYVSMVPSDPTEYEFAMQAFGSWKHWLKIKSAKAIQPWIEDWPTELEVKLRSEGIRKVIQESSSGKSTFNAAKYLANGEWNRASKRGRPTKEEVERERKIAAKLDAEFSEDAQRIGLRVIKGDKENGG